MPTLAEIHKARIVGDGKETVLLGHGFGTDQSVWHNLEPLLTRRHYRVVLYNLMGQGTGVTTGFSNTSLGHSAQSRSSEENGTSDSPRKRNSSALERATSDYDKEELAKELEKMGMFGDSERKGNKTGAFGRRIGESLDRLLGRSKRKEKLEEAVARDQKRGAETQRHSPLKPSHPAPPDPEFSGRRDFKIEDLEVDEKPEPILEEEVAGIVSEQDFNHTRYTTLDAFAEDLVNLIDELGIKQCSYVGHSMSGIIGVLASAKRPDLFKKLVLLASSPRYLNDGDYIGGFHTEDIDNLLAAVKSNYKQWVQGFAPAAIHTPDTAAVADFSAGLLDVRPDVAYSILNTIFRSDFRHVLPKVTVPCHILASNNDVAVPPCVGDYLHKHLRNSVLEQLPTHGHLPHLSSPMIVNAALIKHLEQPP